MGPEGTIHLPREFTPQQRQVFDAAMASITCRTNPTQFFVSSTKPLGGSYQGEEWPFQMITYLRVWEEHADVFNECFGFTPMQHVTFWAWRNGEAPHRIMGEMCTWVADQFGGVVGFGGALHPHAYDRYRFEDDWSIVRPYAHEMLAGMPGKWLEIPYRPTQERIWVVHYADPTFMRAWLEHPKFHMIK